MTIQRLAFGLTIVNLALLVFLAFLLAHIRPIEALAVAPVIRGHSLEIVDDEGRVRASIKVHPENQAFPLPDGSPYPETVLFRLIDLNGGPHVKIGASERGAALVLGGDANPTHIQLLADRADTSVKLTNQDGRQQLIKP